MNLLCSTIFKNIPDRSKIPTCFIWSSFHCNTKSLHQKTSPKCQLPISSKTVSWLKITTKQLNHKTSTKNILGPSKSPHDFSTVSRELGRRQALKQHATMPKASRNFKHGKARQKMQTTKIMDRLTFCPSKHKQKCIRHQRKLLQLQPLQKTIPASSTPTHLKFGSFNINGLDLETNWAVKELLEKRGFDVSLNEQPPKKLSLTLIPGPCLE